MEVLKRGSKGQPVLNLQCALVAAGVFTGDLDGSFGSATAECVKAFQTKQGIAATGIADEKTAALLGTDQPAAVTTRLPGVTPESVARIFPEARLEDIRSNLPFILNAMVAVSLASKDYIAMALATIRTETSVFLPISERQSSLNTSPGGKPFDLYDNRAGLGNKGPDDGATFRGRGFIQLTGRANYLAAGQAIGLGSKLVTNPLLAHNPDVAAKLLANFLQTRKNRLGSALAQGDMVAARRVVNGGIAGLQPFLTAYRDCQGFLPQNMEIHGDKLVA